MKEFNEISIESSIFDYEIQRLEDLFFNEFNKLVNGMLDTKNQRIVFYGGEKYLKIMKDIAHSFRNIIEILLDLDSKKVFSDEFESKSEKMELLKEILPKELF